MSKKHGSEADFIRSLKKPEHTTLEETPSATAPHQSKMILNTPPSSEKNITTDALYEQELAKERESNTAREAADALLETLPSDQKVRIIPLHLIDDSPYQPRRHYNQSTIAALGESMLAAGQMEDVTVRVKGNRFELLGGHRRTRAARGIQWSEISARIKQCDDHQAELFALLQNEGREDLTEYERGHLYNTAIEHKHCETQREAAKLFGCSLGTINNCLSILSLPPEILVFLDNEPGLFGWAQAKVILRLLADHPSELDLIIKAVNRLVAGADKASLHGWVMQMLSKTKRTTKATPSVVPDASGKTLFSTKTIKNQVIITVEAEISVETVQKWMLASLRERAEKIEVKDENS
jgi:ParB family chromosome partitioning protein